MLEDAADRKKGGFGQARITVIVEDRLVRKGNRLAISHGSVLKSKKPAVTCRFFDEMQVDIRRELPWWSG